jgi:hypothetical protein
MARDGLLNRARGGAFGVLIKHGSTSHRTACPQARASDVQFGGLNAVAKLTRNARGRCLGPIHVGS